MASAPVQVNLAQLQISLKTVADVSWLTPHCFLFVVLKNNNYQSQNFPVD